MDTAIVQEALQKRKLRALCIVEAGLVNPNGLAHQYDVQSQSGNGHYPAATSAAFPPHGQCSCQDFQKNGAAFPCKHVKAAEVYEAAESAVLALCERHGCTLAQLGNHILYDLAAGIPDPIMATKITILLHTVQRLKAEEEADLLNEAVDRRIEELKDAYDERTTLMERRAAYRVDVDDTATETFDELQADRPCTVRPAPLVLRPKGAGHVRRRYGGTCDPIHVAAPEPLPATTLAGMVRLCGRRLYETA